MLKKLLAVFLVVISVFSLTACGETSSVFREIEDIEAKFDFPEAKSDKYTIDSVSGYVKAQQDALLQAYVYNIESTDIKLFKNKIEEDRISSLIPELNKKRMKLNEQVEEIFFSNMEVILENVTDFENKEAFMTVKRNEVLEFSTDYIRILNIDSEAPDLIDKMVQDYIVISNEFANGILRENKDKIIDKVILMVEENSKATESFQTYINLNNESVKAINYLFGGVGENVEFRTRINDSNYRLLEKTIEAMPDVTEADKESMLAQLRENQRLSNRSIREEKRGHNFE